MAKNPDAPKLVLSEPLDLPGRRKMKVFAYDRGVGIP
jgi:hypothetical protein